MPARLFFLTITILIIISPLKLDLAAEPYHCNKATEIKMPNDMLLDKKTVDKKFKDTCMRSKEVLVDWEKIVTNIETNNRYLKFCFYTLGPASVGAIGLGLSANPIGASYIAIVGGVCQYIRDSDAENEKISVDIFRIKKDIHGDANYIFDTLQRDIVIAVRDYNNDKAVIYTDSISGLTSWFSRALDCTSLSKCKDLASTFSINFEITASKIYREDPDFKIGIRRLIETN